MDASYIDPSIPMKIGFALIRKEADLYRSQGLHGEALELYARFIARSEKIDPGTKSSIEKQIKLIELEMKRREAEATRELSAAGSDLTKKSRGASAIESNLLMCAQDQAQPRGCSQKDESDIESLDWADGMVAIYALVSNEKARSSPENLKEKARFNDAEAPEMLLNQDSPGRKRFQRDDPAKSFIKIIAAFVLVGSIFFYIVNWLSEVQKDKGGGVVQKASVIVIKKMPTFVSNEPTSTLPDNGWEDRSATRVEEKPVIGDRQSVVDPAETQEKVKNFPSPTNDNKIAPGEPDPAHIIDYVLKKRGRQF